MSDVSERKGEEVNLWEGGFYSVRRKEMSNEKSRLQGKIYKLGRVIFFLTKKKKIDFHNIIVN